jgi:hypothetical protein
MIKEKIYDYFLDTEKKPEAQEDVTFAPSYISSCERQIYYKKTGQAVTNPISEAAYYKMAMGTCIHDYIQKLIENIDGAKLIECENLKNITIDGIEFNYRLDGILEINGKKYILEIKTTYGAGARYIEKDGEKPDHKQQMYMYMNFENIENGILLYICKDSGFMIEFVYEGIKLRNGWFSEKIEQLKKLKSKIETKQIPDRQYQIRMKNVGGEISENFTKDKVKYKSDWQCSYCQWKNECWKDALNEIKNNKFYIDNEFIKE